MNIAILNLSDIHEVQYSIDCMQKMHDEIISCKIDLYVDIQVEKQIKNTSLINEIIPLDLQNLNIFNFKNRYSLMKYYSRNRYHIAIDTQGTFKSSLFNYFLAGKTAGFQRLGYKNTFITLLYDEKIELIHEMDKEYKTKLILSETFGF